MVVGTGTRDTSSWSRGVATHDLWQNWSTNEWQEFVMHGIMLETETEDGWMVGWACGLIASWSTESY